MRRKQSYKARMMKGYNYSDSSDSDNSSSDDSPKRTTSKNKKSSKFDDSDSSDSDYSSSDDSSKRTTSKTTKKKTIRPTRSKRRDDYSSDSGSSSDDDPIEVDLNPANRYNTPVVVPKQSNENLNEQEKRMIKSFNLVFGNMVLSNQIFSHSRLYKKNESQVTFKSLSSLKQYPEKEYLSSIVYKGYEELKYGDLPMNSVSLKQLEFTQDVIKNLNVIPYGVEILSLGHQSSVILDLSKLPLTITQISGVPVNIANGYIPRHITSISFYGNPNISNPNNPNNPNYIVLPNTIKNLKLYKWNEQVSIRPGDIPLGVTSFEGNIIDNSNFNCLPSSLTELKIDSYELEQLSKLVLPNSLKHLTIHCFHSLSSSPFSFNAFGNTPKTDYSNGLFNFIPPNLETLDFHGDTNITVNSNLSTRGTSIKKLHINFPASFRNSGLGSSPGHTIEPNSLPPNVVELLICSFSGTLSPNIIPDSVVNLTIYQSYAEQFTISKRSIPNSVKSLTLQEPITSSRQFPKSLTYLHILENLSVPIKDKSIQKMIDILPRSLTSITLPYKFKQYHKDIPKRIEIVNNNKIVFPDKIIFK